MEDNLKKIFQKKIYDIISHKYGILMLLAGAFLITLSAIHFGEAWLEWSHEKYEAVFNSFSDNIAGRSFRERLSAPLPIDVVYTWVNGTDPDLTRQLELVKISLEEELNVT
ncbi:N-acetylglucosamine-1-phosphotransferase subunits alpha/beta, partial [Biomphalaria glabrata]